jgi:hypothetical protein
MMSHYHAVAWIDHNTATVWQYSPTDQDSKTLHADSSHQRTHNRKSTHGGHKSAADPHFFDEVAAALAGTHEILVMGPAQTKHEFVTYLKAKHADLAKSIVAVESSDHPTDAQVLAYARRHFPALDRMQ